MPIRAERFEILDELGLEHITRTYLEKHRTVQSLVRSLFTAREEGETPGAGDFYAWLKARGLQTEWREAVRVKGAFAADESVEVAMQATPKTASADRLRCEALRWQARVCDPATFGEKANMEITANIGLRQQWLEAMLEEDRLDPPAGTPTLPGRAVEAEVVEERGEDQSALPVSR
jgi:hypothetical protein